RGVTPALFQHPGELGPGLWRRVLAAKLAFAVAPAARRDDGGDALVDATGIDRNRGAEARADRADAVRLDVRVLGEKRERVAGAFDLVEADQPPLRALARAAARHIEAQRGVAELLEHRAGLEHVVRVHVAAEAMQHQEGRPALARRDAIGHAHGARDGETIRFE